MLWASESTYQSLVVAAVGSGTLTMESAVSAFSSPLVLPLHDARPRDGMRGSRLGADLVNVTVRFDLLDAVDFGAEETPVEFYGEPVLLDVPLVSPGIEAGTEREVERLENPFGHDFVVPEFFYAQRSYTLSWHEFTRDEILRMKRTIYGRRGKQKAFWLPTHDRDLIPTVPIADDETELRVAGNALATGERDDLFLMVRAYGQNHFAQVLSVTLDGDEQVLELAEALGVAIEANEMTVSLLSRARFDADRVEFLHQQGLGVSARVPVVSLPLLPPPPPDTRPMFLFVEVFWDADEDSEGKFADMDTNLRFRLPFESADYGITTEYSGGGVDEGVVWFGGDSFALQTNYEHYVVRLSELGSESGPIEIEVKSSWFDYLPEGGAFSVRATLLRAESVGYSSGTYSFVFYESSQLAQVVQSLATEVQQIATYADSSIRPVHTVIRLDDALTFEEP